MHLLKTNPRAVLRRLLPALSLSLVVVACSSGGSAGWTYAPLGPTPEPTGTSGPTSGPSGSPGLAVQVETPQSDPLAFVPNTLEVPAATVVQVDYNNDSNLPHNINFFDGPDNSAPSLGATAVVTGPAALESVTFTTPSEPGTYFFWCDVHLDAMTGTYTVTP
jgi:plastocyanin